MKIVEENTIVIINGHDLTLDTFVAVARYGTKVQIAEEAIEAMTRSRALAEKISSEGRVAYGITTGFGDFASVAVPEDMSNQLSTNLILSHCTGTGDPYLEEEVRGMMLLRANALCVGISGVRPILVKLLVEMLNSGVIPVIPQKGSLGASGDLAPLAHMGLVLLGRGQAIYKGEVLSGGEAMKRAGLIPLETLVSKHEDLIKTDHAAMEIIDPNRRFQDRDNWVWIRDAEKNKLVVGTQCRILYQDALGRRDIALRFNEMVRNGDIGPVMLGRDHHDTGGTDSPYRETSNIYDGSNFTADMATQCYAGNAARGMSLIALHNGGGTGIGKAINGGFGLVLDGSELTDQIINEAIPWDTMVGVSRRNWARNEHSMETVAEYNRRFSGMDTITMPYIADEKLIDKVFDKYCLK